MYARTVFHAPSYILFLPVSTVMVYGFVSIRVTSHVPLATQRSYFAYTDEPMEVGSTD